MNAQRQLGGAYVAFGLLDITSHALAPVTGLPIQGPGLNDISLWGSSYAIFDNGIIDWSGTINGIKTIVVPEILASPNNFQATPISSRRIDLSWQYSGSNQTGFEIERTRPDGVVKILSPIAANATSFSDCPLDPMTAYTYRIRAIKDAEQSPYSNDTSATTLKRKVLLVHGIYGNGSTDPGGYWFYLYPALVQAGYDVRTIDFRTTPQTNFSNAAHISAQSDALATAIATLTRENRADLDEVIDIVAHSMGGLATRWYLHHPDLWQTVGSDNKVKSGVDKFIMIGTPNLGTDIPLVDPLGPLFVEYWLTANTPSQTTPTHWSDALQDMFSEWNSPPTQASKGVYSYPTGYKLGQWPTLNGQYQSPVSTLEVAGILTSPVTLNAPLDGFRTGALLTPPFNVTLNYVNAVSQGSQIVPLDPRARLQKHAAYYNQQANILGTLLHPVLSTGSPGVFGVNTRRLSPFIFALDYGTSDQSAAHIYVEAGTQNSNEFVEWPTLFGQTLFNFSVTLPGPLQVQSDGAVPLRSVLGIDPITGTSLPELPSYPTSNHIAIFPYHHNQLLRERDSISQVVQWLDELIY